MTEKILVIQTAFIGDAILTLPMLQKLKEKYPESELDVISNPVTSEIFSSSPAVNNVLILDKRGEHKSIFSLTKFARKLKQKKYTKLYSPHRSFRTSLIALFSGIKNTYGFDNSSFKHIYKNIIKYNFNVHEVKRDLDLISFDYDNNSWKILPEIIIADEQQKKVNDFLTQNNLSNAIAIAPGSVWNTKKYPLEYFEKIIDYFTSKLYKIILIGGSKDETICNSLSSRFKESVISVAGKFSIVESIQMLKNVKLLISNDSAPTHMGVCANIPVLTLFCSTSPAFGFYPYNEKSSYLSFDDLSCKPCGIHGYEECPIGTFRCGNELYPQNVISKIEEMLND
jgi:lipopolysaccharide heptosyltransferase II